MCLWQAALCCQHPVPELFFLNSSPRKSLERAILKCVGVHLFPAQGPLVTLPLPETAQDTKPKVLNLHFRPYDLAIAVQVPPLNFWFPQHMRLVHLQSLSSNSYSIPKIQIRYHLLFEAFPGLLP